MKLHHLGFAIALALSTSAQAEENENIENIIVTGSYNPVAPAQITSSAIVVERNALLALSPHSLVDALRQMPSLWVESQGGPGGLTSIVMRGAESNHTLVLVDGVQLNDPTNSRGGSVDLNHINMQSIKRIEIIRGAQSAIYGSDALAGVIHIITMEPGSDTEVNAFATFGNDEYYTYGAGISGSVDNLGYALKAQKKDAGEPLKGSTAENTDLVAKLNWFSDTHQVAFSYRYFDGDSSTYPEQSGGPKFALSDDLDSSDYLNQQAAINWLWQVTPLWNSRVSSTWFNREDDYKSPGIEPYSSVPANGAKADFTRTSTTWVNTIGDQELMWVNVGLETKKEQGVSDGYLEIGFTLPTTFDLDRRIDSAFFNMNGIVFERLLLQASVRHDDAEGFDADQSLQLGARYQLTDNLSFLFNRGEGFKLPSFFALGHTLVGNPELQPESSVTMEFGVEWQSQQLTASANYFDNEYRDLVDFDAELFTNVNRASVDISGIDGHVQWQSLDKHWQVNGKFNYSDIDAPNPLNGRPKMTLGSSLGYRPEGILSYNFQAIWVDERYATTLYTGDVLQQALDSYVRFDANVQYQYDANWQLSLQLTNITNSDYQDDIGFEANGPAFYLGASYSM
ncbi:TonB-dependent receptor plug domain-containing protein [Paraglaciecola arctica]|uniref:Iron complex outermembrane recepter protein n=1 Tax=Paraglaciecola arctica BSs20135 TaxID=493475 RepID=K6YUN2_9ALTE|nr:TonB-dependent receptor [Paraglaciecola arctica]GAC21862.1 iron complex outermembrane recepter protein [Paraglaciecola arctica BSs20135]